MHCKSPTLIASSIIDTRNAASQRGLRAPPLAWLLLCYRRCQLAHILMRSVSQKFEARRCPGLHGIALAMADDAKMDVEEITTAVTTAKPPGWRGPWPPKKDKSTVHAVALTVFSFFDGRGGAKTSFLSISEFSTMLNEIKMPPPLQKALWQKYDKDSSGTMTLAEFQPMCADDTKGVWKAMCELYYLIRTTAQRRQTQLTDEKKRVAMRLFNYLDKDNDANLTFDEFRALALAAGANERTSRKLWLQSVDQSVTLSAQTFCRFVCRPDVWGVVSKIDGSLRKIENQLDRQKLSKVANHIFDVLDQKGPGVQDNVLQFEEFKVLCNKCGMKDEVARQGFMRFDADANGSLSRREFQVFCGCKNVWPLVVQLHAQMKRIGYTLK